MQLKKHQSLGLLLVMFTIVSGMQRAGEESRVHPADVRSMGTPYTKISTDRPCVALTFDDGPDPNILPRLLDLFKKEKVQVTFYLIGENARRYPELVKRIHAEGHEIGNHTMTHANLPQCKDMATVREEIEGGQRVLAEILGYPPATFRTPYLAHDAKVWTVLNDLGLPSINCSRSTDDWDRSFPKEHILDKAINGISAGEVILCHSC